ncbi:hypothetical protein GCM10023317_31930 [Actinopolymorpha pittospori]
MIDRSQPIRSAITVAGMSGHAASSSRIRGSTASTIDPRPARWYRGGPSAANARLTVFLEIPITRAIALIGIFSARDNRRISAQSSTDNTCFLPQLDLSQGLDKGSVFVRRQGVSFHVSSTPRAATHTRTGGG